MIETLFVSPVSACFELRNDAPYYAPEGYQVWLDDVFLGTYLHWALQVI